MTGINRAGASQLSAAIRPAGIGLTKGGVE
jgi:hypothetical protein